MSWRRNSTLFYSRRSDNVTNQEFLDAYDKLGFAQQNFKNKSRRLTWENIAQIFHKLKVQLQIQPTDKVMTLFQGCL